MSGRRRGKSNRRGGRFNKPGGGGGGGGRKGASRTWDDDDDDGFRARIPKRSIRGAQRGSKQDLPKSINREHPRPSRDNVPAPDRAGRVLPQMPLQKIHMTSENQARVKGLLSELQTQGAEESSVSDVDEEEKDEEEEYDELDHREEGQFWDTRDETLGHADDSDSQRESRGPEAVFSVFAVGKLRRYGFDREWIRQALETGTGEVGATLEGLLQQLFTDKYGLEPTEGQQEVSVHECLSQRQEEAMALEAIFEDRFTQLIANTVWTVSLDLQTHSRDTDTRQSPRQASRKDVCKFYLQGSCRYGHKCRYQHQRALEPSVSSQFSFNNHTAPLYELEIRFPKSSLYPFQAPLIAFSTSDERVGGAGRLCLTEHLYGRALEAARMGQPVVYMLVRCCEEEAVVKELLAHPHHKYSSPPRAGTISSTAPSSRSKSPPYTHLFGVREEEEDPEVPVENESYVNLRKRMNRKYDDREQSSQQDIRLCLEFKNKQSSKRFLSMLHQRHKLPAWKERENILEFLKKCQVLVVSGMTGCGKTTQIPQFILDDSLAGPPGSVANIICTQPRRISAISVAQRVAQERAEQLGHSVGYQIRLESVRSSATRLLYCTTGVLLRKLEGEPDLQGVTHVVVDEVHERTEESDFLLLVLKDLMVQRPDLKIILMSATLNAELFSQYFSNCPSIHIPGLTFPVDEFFLEDAIEKTRYVLEDGSLYACSRKHNDRRCRGIGTDSVDQVAEDMWSFMSFQKKDFVKDSIPDQKLSLQELMVRYKDTKQSVLRTIASLDLDKINMDLVESLLEWIVEGDHGYPPGAVLVFLPGLAEIKLLYEQLQSNRLFNNRHQQRCLVYPLHSSLSNEEQQAVFSRPPKGVTKIIISTNIAETSITIDDVVYVVDTGKMKEKRYDASKSMEILEDTWVSRANALQRKGRAGRVASGVCFHLFTSHCFMHQLAEQQLPEIQRIPLEQLCLRIKILDVFAEQPLELVFSRLIEPPTLSSLMTAKQRLQDLGALTPSESLTPLGYHLACLPVDVRVGKLMLFGAIFRCLDPALTIAASLAFKSPFVSPWDKQEQANVKKLELAVANSDHLTLLKAYKGWCDAARRGRQAIFHYCKENFLSPQVLQEISSLKRQFTELLSDIGFVKEGLRARVLEQMYCPGADGVLEATGYEANLNSNNLKLMSAMLCAALYPNVVQIRAPPGRYQITNQGAMKKEPKADELRFVTKSEGYVHLHPSSVNYMVRHYDSPYLVYHEKVKTSRVFIRDCSMVCAYPLVLFGGGQVTVEQHKGQFIIQLDDGWIRFAAASHQVAELIKQLRWELDQLLEDKIKNPLMNLCTCPRGSRIIAMIVELISTQ